MKEWSLKGKKALVTGGTRGIGKAIVKELLSLEAEVILVSRDEESVKDVVREFSVKDYLVYGVNADVSTKEGIEKIKEAINANWNSLDILVHNVGTNIRKPYKDYEDTDFKNIFNTNLFSAVEISRELLPFIQGHTSSIILISSVAGKKDIGSGPAYAMTKAAMSQLGRSLAIEYAPLGIRVNTVSPWYTRTDLTAGALGDPEKLAKIINRTPLKKVGEPEDVAALVAFLCMDKASHITGQDIDVDGGMMASIW
jgi:tropinone reductase I